MKRNSSLTAGLFLFLTVISSCGKKEQIETIVRTAKIETVRRTEGGQKLVYPGIVRSSAEANLSFRVAGAISRIPYGEGQFVRKGAVVAEMDGRDYRVQLSAAEAEYNQIKSLTERVSELYKRGSATKNDYEKALSGLEQISAKLEHCKNQLAYTRLLAPFDGYVQEKLHQAGEIVNAGTPVLALAGNGEWLIEINLPIQDYARKNEFQRFEASLSTDQGKKYPLEIHELSLKGNANQVYKTMFRIKKTEDLTLAVGMSVEVSIYYQEEHRSFCAIPGSALFERQGRPHVWIFTSEEKPLEARAVLLHNADDAGFFNVEEGLAEGEKIVTAGIRFIKDGTKVRPI
jgi:RND family efflux transporter MFP subunit